MAAALHYFEENYGVTHADASRFRLLPFSLFSYWCPDEVLRVIDTSPTLEPQFGESVKGLTTFDDFRFVRLAWECDYVAKASEYRYIAKGGGWSRYYSENQMIVDWRSDGEILRANERARYGTDARTTQSKGFWFLPGLTYSEVSSLGFSVQPQQALSLFGGSGFCVFPGDSSKHLVWLGFLNSRSVLLVLAMYSTDRHWNSEMVARLPIPDLSPIETQLASLALRQFNLLVSYGRRSETSPYFSMPTSLSCEDVSLVFGSVQREIDELVRGAYGVSPDALATLESNYGVPKHISESTPDTGVLDHIPLWLGCAVGRWDIRYAMGSREAPPLPDPFAPLPVCPPGMLQNAEGLPAAPDDVPADYPLRISWPGIMVDDDGHREDIADRVREALCVIWEGRSDSIEREICALLGVESLRDYLGNPSLFFDDHLGRYSRSRRIAPIYWPLTTSDGSYTLWLYYHRLDEVTLYRCVNDFVDPKLAAVGRQLGGLRSRERDSKDEAELEQLTDLAAELETFRRDLLELARFWRPNLNDGVEITAAPLHALFGHHRWRDRLEKTWDSLREGEFDWAHLAMSIWPARVVPKCTEDRSLAIAHGLEHLFWVEEDEAWRPLCSPAEEKAHQIKTRQSEEREYLCEHLADLAADEGRYLPAMQVWQSLKEGVWDHRRLGLCLFPERAAAAAFEDATDVYHNLTERGQELLRKHTKKNKRLLTKLLVERGTPELVDAVEVTLADEPAALATLWQALERGERDDLSLALELWPDRVVGKALQEPELAAHHGLSSFFWYDDPDEGLRRRQSIRREIEREVERRGGDKL